MWPRTGSTERQYKKASLDDVDPRRGVHDIVQYMNLEGADMSRIDQRYNVNDAKTDMAWKKYLQQEQRYFNQNKRANDAYLSRFDTVADLKTGLFGGAAKAFKSRLGTEVVGLSDVPNMSEDYAVGIGIVGANTFHAVTDPETGSFVRKGSDFGWYDELSDLDRIVIDEHGNFRKKPYNYTDNERLTLGSFGPNHAVVESITNELDADVDLLVARRPVRTMTAPIRLSASPAENSLQVEAGPMDRSYKYKPSRPSVPVALTGPTGPSAPKPMKLEDFRKKHPKKTSKHFMADWFFIFAACIVLFAVVGYGLSL